MKAIKHTLKILTLALLPIACGDDEGNRHGYLTGPCANEGRIPQAPYMQKVRGWTSQGNIVSLFLFGDGGPHLEILGEVEIPRLETLALSISGSLHECLVGEGQFVGNETGTLDEIRFFLKGRRVELQSAEQMPGRTIVTPTISNKFLRGTLLIRVADRGETTMVLDSQ